MTTAQDQQSRELLPCPFCGSPNVTMEHIQSTAYEAFCEFCGASGPCDSEQWRAAKGWNARALPAGMEPVARVCQGATANIEWRKGMTYADLPAIDGQDLYTAAQVQAMLAQGMEHACNLWVDPENLQYVVDSCDHPTAELIPAYIAAAPRPPAAQECDTPNYCRSVLRCTAKDEMRATPAAQERQPLSDEQIRTWWASENGLEDCDMGKLVDFTAVVRAVEAKLGVTGGDHGGN